MAEYKFPTEAIDLPSEGKHYPEGSPLRSGKVDIKYMTAKEEDILTSTNLIQRGTVLDKLMESLIVTPGVKPDDLLLGDINAVMVASRILAYGKDYPIDVICGSCSAKFSYDVDLSKLEMITPTEEPVDGEYTTVLPTGVTVTFKLLLRSDEKKIREEIEALKKLTQVESESTIRLRYMITSVNGNRDPKIIREFSEAMIIRDVRALRENVRKVSPDVDFELVVPCQSCDHTIKVRMPIGANFFWPDI